MPASVPFTFIPGETAQSAQVNANFASLVDFLNALSIPSLPIALANGGTGATTVQQALTNLGLEVGTVLPCNGVVLGSNVTLTQVGPSPLLTSAYSLGVTAVFQSPSAVTGPLTIQIGALPAIPLYDTPGVSQTASIAVNQLCLVTYSPSLNAWVLVNTPPSSGAGFLEKANNLSDVSSTGTALTNIGGAALAAFTTGLVLAGTGSAPFAGGLVIKWGTATCPSSGGHTSSVAVTFATPFPTNCFGAVCVALGDANSSSGGQPSAGTRSPTPSGFGIGLDTLGFTTFNQTCPVFWIAIGN